MMESYLDVVEESSLQKATDEANDRIKSMEKGGWSMVQSQLIPNHNGMFSYSIVYQRINTKGEREDAVQVQSAEGVSLCERAKGC